MNTYFCIFSCLLLESFCSYRWLTHLLAKDYTTDRAEHHSKAVSEDKKLSSVAEHMAEPIGLADESWNLLV